MSNRERARDIAEGLRRIACGQHYWRVQDKDTKAYCIEFEDWEQYEAKQWWDQNKANAYYANHELARVHVLTEKDRLLIEAATLLEELSK